MQCGLPHLQRQLIDTIADPGDLEPRRVISTFSGKGAG